jgi:hypothetical protein
LFDRLASAQPTSLPPDLVRRAAAPTAESASINRSADAATQARALSPAQSGQSDVLRVLPPPSDEVRHVRIGWYVNRAIDAFRTAIDRNVPLVLVASVEWCSHCRSQVLDALRCPDVDRFAGDAVFAISSPEVDLGAKAIAGSLNINAYPTVTVLEPEARMLLERGRINGNFAGSTMGEHLDTIIRKTPPRRYEDQPIDGRQGSTEGAPSGDVPMKAANLEPQTSVLETWGDAGTAAAVRLEWIRRGFKHIQPAPKCE